MQARYRDELANSESRARITSIIKRQFKSTNPTVEQVKSGYQVVRLPSVHVEPETLNEAGKEGWVCRKEYEDDDTYSYSLWKKVHRSYLGTWTFGLILFYVGIVGIILSLGLLTHHVFQHFQ